MFFFFSAFPKFLGAATVNQFSPPSSIFHIPTRRHSSHLHILFHPVHEPPFWSSFRPFAWQFKVQHSFLFFSGTVFKPYSIAGLTTVLYIFPFIFADSLLSRNTLDTFLQPNQPACTCFCISFPHFPLLCIVEPRYLKSSTFLTSTPCNLTDPL